MKLYYSATSPFARKCLITAHELGLRERLELIAAAPHPVRRDQNIVALNPLGQVPTLIADDSVRLYDSRVICEYLDHMGGGHMFPRQVPERWRALVEQALADGILDAAVLVRYETAVRPESLRWDEWIDGQLAKVNSSLTEVERRAPAFGDRVDIGTISVACALGYLDFRFASLAWRERCPAAAQWFERFALRGSMAATRPPAA